MSVAAFVREDSEREFATTPDPLVGSGQTVVMEGTDTYVMDDQVVEGTPYGECRPLGLPELRWGGHVQGEQAVVERREVAAHAARRQAEEVPRLLLSVERLQHEAASPQPPGGGVAEGDAEGGAGEEPSRDGEDGRGDGRRRCGQGGRGLARAPGKQQDGDEDD